MHRRAARLTTSFVVVGVVAAVAVIVGGVGGCGILNGLFGDAEVTTDELCARVSALESDANDCLGVSEGEGEGEGGGAGVVNSVLNASNCDNKAECLGENNGKGKCPDEGHAPLPCELDNADKKKDCSEISGPAGASGFCGAEIDAYVSCTGIDLASCNNNGGGGCNGHEGYCEINDDPSTCPDCWGPNWPWGGPWPLGLA